MIILVGVAHVVDLKRQIENVILQENPDIVAVELDYGRYYAMKNKVEGKMPYMYRKMSEMQKKLAEMLGTEVGSEMLTAVDVAQAMGKEVVFIDMDARQIAENIKKRMTLREKLRIYCSLIMTPFYHKKLTEDDVKEVIDNEERYIKYLREKFPGLSKALFEDREEVMAKNLKSVENKGCVIAFVGDGHLKGLAARIPDAKIIKLKDLVNKGKESMGFSYTLSFN